MSDTPDNAVPIGEFVADARRHLEQTLPPLWVGGEIAGFTAAASGHWYFVLRDENGQADCVMLARDNRAVSAAARPKDGDHIALFGRPTLYAPRGRFQLQAKFIRAAGAGRLYAEFVRRKREWAERGWFANARPLPLLPDCVGVVSSLAGAALRDVLRTLGRRAPGVAVVVYPAPAQGEGAAEKIGAAVRIAGRRAECDVLVVCRGGGGMEDLWAYNEEAVVAAVYESPLPVVTGIGHEIDETLADFAADHRAATPTAAAVAAVPDAAELLRQNSERARRLRHLAEGRLDEAGQRLDWAAKLLAPPEHLLAAKRQHLRRLAAELRGAAKNDFELLP